METYNAVQVWLDDTGKPVIQILPVNDIDILATPPKEIAHHFGRYALRVRIIAENCEKYSIAYPTNETFGQFVTREDNGDLTVLLPMMTSVVLPSSFGPALTLQWRWGKLTASLRTHKTVYRHEKLQNT